MTQNDYPLLFSIIGHTFSSDLTETEAQFIFVLPNGRDRVIGISGQNHIVGEIVNSEENEIQNVEITESNIPSHYHLMMDTANDGCKSNWGSSYPYLAEDCHYGSNLIESWDDKYSLRSTNVAPTRGRTSSVGSSEPLSIDIMQPTIFVGNLFIYAG